MSPCTPTDVMEKQLAFIGRASLLSSAGTGKTAFKFPFWHFCGDTLVKIIKVNPDKNATHELSIMETMWSLESSRALKKNKKKNRKVLGSKVEMEYQKEERDNQSHRERDNSLLTNAMLLSVAEQWV